ncbi:MAG: cob(I)yrinic acid a,c-diamide adenosyltransferase [Gemmatimonadota bacterium]
MPPGTAVRPTLVGAVARVPTGRYHLVMTRIYTRRGDRGETGLFGGGRVPKAHPRVEAYGAVDELNAVVGWALSAVAEAEIRDRLDGVQADLFAIGAHLATPPAPSTGGGEPRRRPALPPLPDGRVEIFERAMDEIDEELPELRAFILPGGSPGAAALHVARTVCRRVERRVAALAAQEDLEPGILVYLNRLSDLLFVLARLANHRAGRADRSWQPARSPGDGRD